MQCPRCGKEIESGSKYCIYCGSPISSAEPEKKQKFIPIDEEINQLRQLIAQITKRLDNLESRAKTVEGPTPLALF